MIEELDNLGVSHSESAGTLHTSISAATLGANLGAALEIYADVLLRPHLDDAEIDPIRALAVQALQSLEDDPGSKVIHELRKRHFPDPWGRASCGDLQGVESAAADDLRAYFHERYQSSGAILGVAGAIDWPQLKDCVEKCFNDWKPLNPPKVKEKPVGPPRDHIFRETNQIQISLAYPSEPLSSPNYYLARAAVGVLGGYSSARLFTEVREKRGLCYSVGASYETHKERAAVICHAGTAADRAQQTLDVTLAELARLGADGVEQEELDTMRAGLKSSLVMQQESTMSRASSLTADWFHLGRIRPLEEICKELDALTPKAVNEYLAKNAPGNQELTILTLGPTALDTPA